MSFNLVGFAVSSYSCAAFMPAGACACIHIFVVVVLVFVVRVFDDVFVGICVLSIASVVFARFCAFLTLISLSAPFVQLFVLYECV